MTIMVENIIWGFKYFLIGDGCASCIMVRVFGGLSLIFLTASTVMICKD